MSAAFPVFIGVTGKRHFSNDALIAKTLERTVSDRLAGVFDYLDTFLPTTPKILLTGAALGADLIAAEEVLGLHNGGAAKKRRPNWLVLAVLPFAEELFRQDFKDEEWERYRRVVEDSRTRVLVLPPLLLADGATAQTADLERRPDATPLQHEARRHHYEQVGLWIADTANVLLAILATSERAGNIGGTARILACRRSAELDPAAMEVVRASAVLAPRSDLERAPNGFAWLIDPAAEPLCASPPVTVLPPASDLTPLKDVYATPATQGWGGPGGGEGSETTARQSTHLRESCRVLKIAHDFVRDSKPSASSKSSSQSSKLSSDKLTANKPAADQPAAVTAWPTAEGRVAILQRIAKSMHGATNKAAQKYRSTVYWLVGCFVLAVLAFETFAKFAPDKPHLLIAYLVIIGLAMIGYMWAGWRDLQPMAEDRRSVREALRVQEAWWQAGLDNRVDFVHLTGVDQDLARVRGAIRNVIAYALVAGKPAHEAPKWSAVFDQANWPPLPPNAPARKRPRDWIGEQFDYFRQRQRQRHMRGKFMEAAGWALFVTATCLALLLLSRLLFVWVDRDLLWFLGFVDHKIPYWETMLATVMAILATALCWWFDCRLVEDSRTSWRRFLLTIAINLPAALFLFLAARLVATAIDHPNESIWLYCAFLAPVFAYTVYFMWKIVPDTNNTHPRRAILGLALTALIGLVVLAAVAVLGHHFDQMSNNGDSRTELIAEYITIVMVVFLPAMGGAVRFMSEKLAVEAEALSYRDARLWFERAGDRLAELKPGHGDERADSQARGIVGRLGVLAMSENESWLKLRRQRPLSPVI